MFSTFTPEFTRGALLTVNSIEMLAVLYGVLVLLNFLSGIRKSSADQLTATVAQTEVLKELLAAQQNTAEIVKNSQPKG